jgi:hypothetical protein
LSLAPSGALAGDLNEGEVVEMSFGRTSLTLTPCQKYSLMTLTVTGPYELVFEQTFKPGKQAVFELPQNEMIDGSYTWEVRVDPLLDQEIVDILAATRKNGDDARMIQKLMRDGRLPHRPQVQSGGFQVVDRAIIYDRAPEPRESRPAKAAKAVSGGSAPATAKDYVINNDLIVDGSACVGFDCVDGWTFSFTTIGMSEHNTRIKFDDTSYTASYPRNDWQLLANDSTNGGLSKFSIIDCGDNDTQGNCSGTTTFTIEAGADSNSIYVDDAGRVGFGTGAPTVELHVVDGNTPTLRLAQDGSSGFTPQTFDVAGNESNFFIRDATNGSRLPFRIRPGAPTSSIDIAADGDIGMGTGSPGADGLHISRTTSGAKEMLKMTNNGGMWITFENTNSNDDWYFTSENTNEGDFIIDSQVEGAADGPEFTLEIDGDLTIAGNLVTGGGGTCDPGPCDAVFTDYELESIEEHAAFMWEHKHLWGVGPTPEGAPINLSKKTTGILHELEKAHIYIEQLNTTVKELEAAHSYIEQLHAEVQRMKAENQGLNARLAAIEQQLNERE